MDMDLIMSEKIRENIEELDELMEQSMDTLLCGPECQRIRTENELEQKYINALMNLETAPIVLEDTKRNYYVFTEGENYYNNILQEELEKEANEIANKISNQFNDKLTNVNIMNKYFNSHSNSYENETKLYNKIFRNNEEMEQKIEKQYGNILTNNRKTFYSNEAFDRLIFWHNFFWYIYYILLFILLISFVFVETTFSKITRIVLFIILLVYPYIIHPSLKFIYMQLLSIYNKIPINIYKQM
jgi:hypothetical protein